MDKVQAKHISTTRYIIQSFQIWPLLLVEPKSQGSSVAVEHGRPRVQLPNPVSDIHSGLHE